MATTIKKAETAQELKEKYQKKRLTATSAAQYYLYNYLYWAYLHNENKPISASDRVLKDDSRVYELLGRNYTPGDKASRLYEIYCNLCEWLNSAFDSAVLMRNSLNTYLSMGSNEIFSLLAGEMLRRELKNTPNKEVSFFIGTITLEYDNLRYSGLSQLKEKIQETLCYLKAYNTLIDIIAREIKIPELTIFQVDTFTVVEEKEYLNRILNRLSSVIEEREVAPKKTSYISFDDALATLNNVLGKGKLPDEKTEAAPSAHSFTQQELNRIIKVLKPIEDAAPIPTANIVQAENIVKAILSANSNNTWSMAFNAIKKHYVIWPIIAKKAGGAKNG